MKVVVVQIGARHHYAVPRMLERLGYLTAFHTDAISVAGLGRILPKIPILNRDQALRKLSQRVPIGVTNSKIRQTDSLLWQRIREKLHLSPVCQNYIEDDHRFDEITAAWGFAGADTLYAMQKHGTKLLEAARASGIRVVVDVFITPLAHRIVEEERRKFPDLEQPLDDEDAMILEDERNLREFALADLLLCPASNVVEGVKTFITGHDKKIAVVPYGCGVSFGKSRNQPLKGRILFAGTADLRKGIHYFANAASKLNSKLWDFRVAGNVSEKIRKHPSMRHLNFLGRLPASEMRQEFLAADVFVLPTLAEGCASVVHEAVMAGCPVITTDASGTLIRNGIGGLIVPERNSDALAEAIEQIIVNRSLRDELATSGRTLATELSETAWERRLCEALKPQ